jgi:predicted transcriptional regulator
MSDKPYLDLTTKIVVAYLAKGQIGQRELPAFIGLVYRTFIRANADEPAPVVHEPAVPIRRSVRPDQIFCLECGKAQKSLKRHLGVAHDLDSKAYRAKWGLPRDYPMVAPNQSRMRSEIARASGLGSAGRARNAASRRAAPQPIAPVVSEGTAQIERTQPADAAPAAEIAPQAVAPARKPRGRRATTNPTET